MTISIAIAWKRTNVPFAPRQSPKMNFNSLRINAKRLKLEQQNRLEIWKLNLEARRISWLIQSQ